MRHERHFFVGRGSWLWQVLVGLCGGEVVVRPGDDLRCCGAYQGGLRAAVLSDC